MKIDEAARKAEIHSQQLAIVNERVHKERKYHRDGQVRTVPHVSLVLAIDVVQFRAYRRCDIHFLRLLKTGNISANDRSTKQIYAAEIKGRAVTVVMKRLCSEMKDDTLDTEDIRTSEEEGDSPTDLTVLKRVL